MACTQKYCWFSCRQCCFNPGNVHTCISLINPKTNICFDQMLRLQFKIWVGLYLLKLKGACGVVIPTLGWWRTRPADPTTWGWPRTQWEIKHVRGFIMQSGFNSPPHQLHPQCPVNNMFVHMGRSFLTGVHIRRLPERLGDSAPLVLVDRTPPNGLTWVALNKILAFFFFMSFQK